jgi:hypothetical protein
MARYVGGSLAVAAAATVYDSATQNHLDAGDSASVALAAGLSRASVLLALLCAAGVALIVLLRRHHVRRQRAVDRAAAAAVTTHTIPLASDGTFQGAAAAG